MAKIEATEFKAKCLELMDRVASRRETFLITKRDRPVAKLVPIAKEPRRSVLGCLREKVEIRGDIVSSVLPPDAWNAVGEWDVAEKTPKRNTPNSSVSRRQR